MKKMIKIVAIVLLLLVFIGCTTHIHKVGNGPQTYNSQEERQWYILWGLVPLNEVDTNDMAGDAKDYEITTEIDGIDVLIGIVASAVSVSSRTVTVTK